MKIGEIDRTPGQRAWTKIKATAAEQRQLWRDVGEALLEGRAMWPANQAFGAWCANEGFDMDARVRSDAMWLGTNWAACFTPWKTDATHPTHIRSAHRDAQVPLAPEDTAFETMLANAAKLQGEERSILAKHAHAPVVLWIR